MWRTKHTRNLIACVLLILLVELFGCGPAVQSTVLFQEDFGLGSLDSSQWEVTIDGDFAEAVVDVADVDPGEDTDYRLRLQANTIGTSDPLKFLGVRSKNEVDLSAEASVSFDLDWNNQANGCYLTAALYLCPTVSSNPRNESNWLKFEYVGVPPGRNIRINIWEKVHDAVNPLHTDWGPTDDQGRPIGKALGRDSHRVQILLEKGSLQVFQDGEQIYHLSEYDLKFDTAYIYLQMSSGTNYPSREVYFDNVLVQEMASGTAGP